MGNVRKSGISSAVIYVTLVLVLSLSLAWLYLQTEEIRRQSLVIGNLRDSNAAMRRDIITLHARRAELEEEFQLLQGELDTTGGSLDELLAQDWPGKFERLQDKYRDYRQTVQQQQVMADAEVARLQRALEFHQSANRKLNQALASFESHQQQNQATIAQLDAEKEQLSLVIDDLEKRLQTTRQLVEQNTAAASAGTNKPDNSGDYRRNRLQSLQSALSTQDSASRRAVLIDVLPTIPGGVSVNELLHLVTGMQSGDILAVIQNTRDYIAGPLDNKTVSALAGAMNDEDAVTASLILTER